jgi:murein DD-endopeptidase MepM/ murein hydrolase activator NlpD
MQKISTLSLMATFIVLLAAGCGPDKGPAPVTLYGASEGPGSAGMHTVSKNETLYRIAARYNLPMRDIIAVNDLSPPYMLRAGQRIELPPPRNYTVRSGDTLYGISRLFGVSSTDIARLNDLRAPYTLQSGETLRLPPAVPEAPTQSAAAQGMITPAARPQAEAANTSSAAVTTTPPARSAGRFLTPVKGPVISGYGPKKDGLHNDGINIRAPRNTPVKAAENGVVVYAGRELEGYGNLILLRHADRWMTAYAHLDQITVKRGQTIKRGAQIGTVGTTGSVDEPQLHFEIRRGADALNPKRYME